ncbi:hypothetical protein JCM33374_g2576 [Metschnikowia sp. JCM 33374]|nr:hypothetical protein JCM33374_g2576 [Metschnikowia sp. JCM 33374]
MWPGKKPLGSQLTYGVSGSPVVVSAPVKTPNQAHSTLKYPRLQGTGPVFHPIDNSTVELSPPTPENDVKLRHSQVASSVNLHDEIGASEELLAALDADARPFYQPEAYDPSKGPLSTWFLLGMGAFSEPVFINGKPYKQKAKSTVISVRCHAFTSDPCTLKVFPMMPKNKNFLDTKRPEHSQKALFGVPDTSKLAVELRFPFQILQIEVCRDHKLIAVRGVRQVAFVAFSWNNTPGNKGIILNKAFSIVHEQADLAHITFGPNKFVFIDVVGTCKAYSFILRENWEYSLISEVFVPRFEPSDTSAWKRLCWPSAPSSDYFYVFTRKSTAKVSIKTSNVNKLITFFVWSSAQDVVLLGQNLFLLTSQELIWIRVSAGGEFCRLLSWKHYLDNQDVTLKLTTCYCSADDAFVCIIYSQVSPLSLMLSFGMRDGLPCSLSDPTIFPTFVKNHTFMSIFEAGKANDAVTSLVMLAEMDATYRSVITTYCDLEDRAFRAQNPPSVPILEPKPLMLALEDCEALFAHLGSRVNMTAKSDPPEQPQPEPPIVIDAESNSSTDSSGDKETDLKDRENDQTELIQNYAFKLGEDVQSFFERNDSMTAKDAITLVSCRPLTMIAEMMPTGITDLEELESMLTQLAGFYDAQGVSLLPFDSDSLGKYDEAFKRVHNSIKEIPSALSKFAEGATSQAAVILASSLTKAHGDFFDDYMDCVKEETEGYPKELLSTLDEWNIDVSSATLRGKSAVSIDRPSSQTTPKANGQRQKSSLLRRALEQNSQLVVDSQDQRDQELENFFASRNHGSTKLVQQSQIPMKIPMALHQ